MSAGERYLTGVDVEVGQTEDGAIHLPRWEPGMEMFEADRFVPPVLGRLAEQVGYIRLGPGKSLWRYDGGVYRDDGDEWLASFVREKLGDRYRDNRLREVRSWCRANTGNRLPIQPTTDYINVANGILYWREDPLRLAPHSPDVASIMQLPVAFDPEAECPATLRYLERVLPAGGEVLTFLFEWWGYLLVPASKYQRALMLLGPRDSGKSTLLNLTEAFLGSDSVSHHSLQSICDDRFTAADLYGRLANICADLDAKSIEHSGRFKTITAGDKITAEKKYQDHFSYRPFARLIFSANEAPGTADQSGAYYKRWLVLKMDRSIPKSEQRPGLIGELTTPSELAGMLALAVGGLRQLERRGRFTEPECMEEAAADYRLKTDTVAAWVAEACIFEHKAHERDGTLYEAYKDWCTRNGRHSLGLQRWRDHLGTEWPHLDFRPRFQGYPDWSGVRIRTASDLQEYPKEVTEGDARTLL